MSKLKMYRQGDVLFLRRTKISPKAKKLTHLVIAEGEVTGHMHEVKENKVVLYEDGNVKWLENNSPVTIIHPEHNSIRLPRGKYEIIIQREYSPEGVHNVYD